MARFKKFRSFRRKARSFGKKSRGKSKSGSSMNPMGYAVRGAIYGAARTPIVKLASPLTDKLAPYMKGYEDEAVMGLASWAAAKWGSGEVKKMGLIGLTVEAASVGAGLSSNLMSGVSASSGNNGLFIN